MSDMNQSTVEEIISDLAGKDPFFDTPQQDERSRIGAAFEWAAWDSCPHSVVVLHRQGKDAEFNRKVKQAMHTTMNLPPTRCLAGIIAKRPGINGSSVDWNDTRMHYNFSNPDAAVAFAASAARDFGLVTVSHTVTGVGPDRRVFTPHAHGPRPG